MLLLVPPNSDHSGSDVFHGALDCKRSRACNRWTSSLFTNTMRSETLHRCSLGHHNASAVMSGLVNSVRWHGDSSRRGGASAWECKNCSISRGYSSARCASSYDAERMDVTPPTRRVTRFEEGVLDHAVAGKVVGSFIKSARLDS